MYFSTSIVLSTHWLPKDPPTIEAPDAINGGRSPEKALFLSIYSYLALSLLITSSFFSFAERIKFYNDILGAMLLIAVLQNGHFFFSFAYEFIQTLQNVCPQGNKMKG